MKALIVYDSTHGNTEKLARSMGDSVTPGTKVVRAAEVKPSDFDGVDLLVAGSPTIGGRPTQPVQTFLFRPDQGTKRGGIRHEAPRQMGIGFRRCIQ